MAMTLRSIISSADVVVGARIDLVAADAAIPVAAVDGPIHLDVVVVVVVDLMDEDGFILSVEAIPTIQTTNEHTMSNRINRTVDLFGSKRTMIHLITLHATIVGPMATIRMITLLAFPTTRLMPLPIIRGHRPPRDLTFEHN